MKSTVNILEILALGLVVALIAGLVAVVVLFIIDRSQTADAIRRNYPVIGRFLDVVWMERGPEAERLAALPVAEFEAAMSARSCHLFGPLRLVTRRSLWPMIGQYAARMSGERTALIAEAAHVVPPIGAQGLNMSLADLRVLLDLATARPDGLGDRAMLDAYHRARHGEVMARVAGIDALNRASMLGPRWLRDLRAGALNALYSAAPVRRTMMKAGLGLR